MSAADPHWSLAFEHSFAERLPGCYQPWQPAPVPAPRLVLFNRALAAQLGLGEMEESALAEFLSGRRLPPGARPIALAYAGHQFGHFNPQLGDGRALLLGEIRDPAGQRWDLHLKGSGATPYARGGDGKAVLGPMLREYLMGEAMTALGIPSTRALAVVATGEAVQRERPLPGAVLSRVARSHIRVGTFQYLAIRDDLARLKDLADYTIDRHYPDLSEDPNPYLALLRRVLERQAELIAQWQAVGFIHGVMNTDNMSIAGETIDYGPCAFMDRYDPATVFSSIDHQGRYAYGEQPRIAQWNLVRLAECLVPLVNDADEEQAIALLTAELNRFPAVFSEQWQRRFAAKLGLASAAPTDDGVESLIRGFLELLQAEGEDFTLAFRRLAAHLRGTDERALGLAPLPASWDPWLQQWHRYIDGRNEDPQQLAARMDACNPIYIPRNHLVEEALAAAQFDQDLGPLRALLERLQDPFTARADSFRYSQPMPAEWGPYRTFCGT
ncbi:YdiU family protein [Acidithiobacillus sp.]|uniref:protein adenylyltransferase SelO n=1 Tax=Acidithiobacillus sp. TaxID=1872118 RepID=UPI0025C28AC2|nr:YdiU family protein [Acidithiobacillus sp.]